MTEAEYPSPSSAAGCSWLDDAVINLHAGSFLFKEMTALSNSSEAPEDQRRDENQERRSGWRVFKEVKDQTEDASLMFDSQQITIKKISYMKYSVRNDIKQKKQQFKKLESGLIKDYTT